MQGDEGRERFAAALSRTVGSRAGSLAEQVGVSEQAVRDWMSGKAVPSPYRVFEVERILKLKPGELSAHLGYMPVGEIPGVVHAIDADPALSDDEKVNLTGTYRLLAERDERGRPKRHNR